MLFVKMHVSDGGGGILRGRECLWMITYIKRAGRTTAFILIDFIMRSAAPLENSNLCVREREEKLLALKGSQIVGISTNGFADKLN